MKEQISKKTSCSQSNGTHGALFSYRLVPLPHWCREPASPFAVLPSPRHSAKTIFHKSPYQTHFHPFQVEGAQAVIHQLQMKPSTCDKKAVRKTTGLCIVYSFSLG